VWRPLEVIHSVTYFSPECRAANKSVGLRGFWMGYFASRAAPMGLVTPAVVEATFYNFHPAMVRRAIPDAWTFASPPAILEARSLAASQAVRRLAPEAEPLADRVYGLLATAVDHADCAGRPLAAANQDVVCRDRVDAIWQATATLREHRGDGHVAVLTESQVDGCQAHVLHAATGGVPRPVLQGNRGWSDDDWAEATEGLRRRGLVDADGAATDAGRQLHDHIERRTDELAVAPYVALGDDAVDELVTFLLRLAQSIARAGEMPFPNPIGLSFDA
jgi:hypothetical protein